MKWVKASKRLPDDEPGRYFVKMSRQQIPANGESNQVASFINNEWYLENHHHSRDFFVVYPVEWLDETPQLLVEEDKLWEEAKDIIAKIVSYDDSELKEESAKLDKFLKATFTINKK